MFKKFRSNFFRKKTEDELDKHYDGLEVEKGDLLAMLIAAAITFLPIVIIISFLYILVAFLFI